MEELTRILSDFQRLLHFPASEYEGVRKANIKYIMSWESTTSFGTHTQMSKSARWGDASISHAHTA